MGRGGGGGKAANRWRTESVLRAFRTFKGGKKVSNKFKKVRGKEKNEEEEINEIGKWDQVWERKVEKQTDIKWYYI